MDSRSIAFLEVMIGILAVGVIAGAIFLVVRHLRARRETSSEGDAPPDVFRGYGLVLAGVPLLALVAISVFLIGGMRKRALVPGRWQSMAELSYEFIANLIRDTVGNDGRRYFPIVFTVFMFVLFGNLLGMVPNKSNWSPP